MLHYETEFTDAFSLQIGTIRNFMTNLGFQFYCKYPETSDPKSVVYIGNRAEFNPIHPYSQLSVVFHNTGSKTTSVLNPDILANVGSSRGRATVIEYINNLYNTSPKTVTELMSDLGFSQEYTFVEDIAQQYERYTGIDNDGNQMMVTFSGSI